nr:cystatin [Aristotelia chilensis]
MATSVQPVLPQLLDYKAEQPLLFNGAISAWKDQMPGGWTLIKDVSKPHVKEIGEFAVDEYNKRSKAALKFKTVICGWTQVVSGINYKLIVEAKDGADTNYYEAVVWEKAWQKFKELTSFKVVIG